MSFTLHKSQAVLASSSDERAVHSFACRSRLRNCECIVLLLVFVA